MEEGALSTRIMTVIAGMLLILGLARGINVEGLNMKIVMIRLILGHVCNGA